MPAHPMSGAFRTSKPVRMPRRPAGTLSLSSKGRGIRSPANAITRRVGSTRRLGYISPTICSAEEPSSALSTTACAGTRVPRTTHAPDITSGLDSTSGQRDQSVISLSYHTRSGFTWAPSRVRKIPRRRPEHTPHIHNLAWTLRAPHVGPYAPDSLFSRGIYARTLIAKESTTLLIACAPRVQGCGSGRPSGRLPVWPRFISS